MNPNPQAEKRRLRRTLVEQIGYLPLEQRSAQERTLIESVPRLPGYHQAKTVLLYVSAFPEEIQTRILLEEALANGKRLVCPRVDRAAGMLRLFLVEDLNADLQPGTLRIPEPAGHCLEIEPAAVDWVLVPGIGFDSRGFRLGRGAGHYDRLLPRLRPTVPRWALAFECQWMEALPVESHDVPLDGVVFPHRRVVRNEVDSGPPPV